MVKHRVCDECYVEYMQRRKLGKELLVDELRKDDQESSSSENTDEDVEEYNENDNEEPYFDPREMLKAQSKFSQYFKMQSVGVPLSAIGLKMIQDGMNEEDVKQFCGGKSK